MTKFNIAKKAVNITVGIGTAKIVGQTIKNNTNPESVVDYVSIFTAACVLGNMAADKTQAYSDEKMDELHTWWNKTVNKNRAA